MPERHALFGGIVLQHLDRDFVAQVQYFRRVRDTAIRNVGDVKQPVDSAEIDKSAVLRQILDGAGEDSAFVQGFESDVLAGFDLFEHGQFARNHDIAALAVQLHDLDRNVLAGELFEVAHGAHIHLRTGHERAHADVDRKAALDAAEHQTGDGELLLQRVFEVVPDFEARRFLVRQDDVTFRRMAALDHHLDQIAGMNRDAAARIGELRERSDAIRLVADIDEDVAAGNLQDPAFENLVAGRRRKMAVILEEMLIFFRIHRRDRRFQWSGRLVVCHCVSSPGSLKSAPRRQGVKLRILSTIERREWLVKRYAVRIFQG